MLCIHDATSDQGRAEIRLSFVLTREHQHNGASVKHRHQYSLFIRLHTLVQFDDMAADEPDQVAEIRDCRLISDVVQHVLVVHCRE